MSEQEVEGEVLGFSVAEVQEAAAGDLDFFGALCLPDDCTLKFPGFYHQMWGMLQIVFGNVRDFSKYAIGFPRGHAKTLWIKLLIVYAILFTKKQFILVVGASASRAQNIIADVQDILDSHNIQATFGNWRAGIEKDTQDLKKFYFNGRYIILAAAGSGTSIRGMNMKNKRPDLIICDDAQTKECAASEQESKNFLQWFFGTLLKAKAPTGCTYLYVGNMYKDIEIKGKKGVYTCLLRNLQKSKHWKSFIVGAILADGTALWEELQPLAQLIEEFEQDYDMGQGEIFAAEVLNDPKAIPSHLLNFENIQRKTKMPGELHQGNYIIIDPAGQKKGADDTCIGYFELYDEAPAFMDIDVGIMSPMQTIHSALEMAIKHNCPLVICEDVAYQETLLYWFTFICGQLGITGIEFHPINPGGYSKNSRIMDYFKSLNAGEALLGDNVCAHVVSQALKFDPQKTTNDDNVLDVAAYADKARIMYGHLMQTAAIEVQIQSQQVITNASPDNYGQAIYF
jgi:hypothetical protein